MDVAAPEFRSRRSPADPVFQRLLGGLALLRIVGRNSRRRALPSRPSRRRHRVRPSVRSVGGGLERHEKGFTTASSPHQNLAVEIIYLQRVNVKTGARSYENKEDDLV